MPNVLVLSTTLRDGLQGPRCDMSLLERLAIAKRLSEMGLYAMEIGFPGSGKPHYDAVVETVRLYGDGPLLSVLARMVDVDIEAAISSLRGAKNGQIATWYPAMEEQIQAKGKTHDEVLDLVQKNIKLAARSGYSVKVYGENALRTNLQFLYSYYEAAIQAGATTISIADSSGTASPEEVRKTVKALMPLKVRYPNVLISFHGHNDFGMAVANAAAAVEEGVDIIEGSCAGIGERAGNTDWMLAVAYMLEKGIADFPGIKTDQFYSYFVWFTDMMGIQVRNNTPIFGENVTITAAGIHMANTKRFPQAYLAWNTDKYGVPRRRDVVTSSVGSFFLEEEAKRLGYALTERQIKGLLELVKEFASGRRVEVLDDELKILIEKSREQDFLLG